MMLTIIFITIALLNFGASYYNTPLGERFYHEDHQILKPSGAIGHGLGIVGSLLMFIGVGSYMIRKRWHLISNLGKLKYWLEFHIFVCTLGPILVLYHTAFKFGGIVSISFWSMVAVFISGIIGRFIYIQIPRTIEGRELSLSEIYSSRENILEQIKAKSEINSKNLNDIISIINRDYNISEGKRNIFIGYADRRRIRSIRKQLKLSKMPAGERSDIIKLIKSDLQLNRRIERLTLMKNLFKYWHVVHLPFAILMLVILLIHVGVTIAFGYKWVF